MTLKERTEEIDFETMTNKPQGIMVHSTPSHLRADKLNNHHKHAKKKKKKKKTQLGTKPHSTNYTSPEMLSHHPKLLLHGCKTTRKNDYYHSHSSPLIIICKTHKVPTNINLKNPRHSRPPQERQPPIHTYIDIQLKDQCIFTIIRGSTLSMASVRTQKSASTLSVVPTSALTSSTLPLN